MGYLTWDGLLAEEEVGNLYPMHYRPNKEKDHSVFLIFDPSGYRNLEEEGREIEYRGTIANQWTNDNFHSLAESRMSSELIKVYYRRCYNRWVLKGFFKLAGVSLKGDNYRYRLVPVENR